ncbi:MAG TPA: hypothetical protein VLX89_07160 [Actinomycetota bacterium]|nr:hypothetical protein [Actinomycetota bacterium]
MVRRALTMLGWGTAGIVVAAALIAGAFAVAGTRLTEPATPIRVSAPRLVSDTQIGQPADGTSPSPSPALSMPTATGDRTTGPSTRSPSPDSDDPGGAGGQRGDDSGGGSGRGDD